MRSGRVSLSCKRCLWECELKLEWTWESNGNGNTTRWECRLSDLLEGLRHFPCISEMMSKVMHCSLVYSLHRLYRPIVLACDRYIQLQLTTSIGFDILKISLCPCILRCIVLGIVLSMSLPISIVNLYAAISCSNIRWNTARRVTGVVWQCVPGRRPPTEKANRLNVLRR